MKLTGKVTRIKEGRFLHQVSLDGTEIASETRSKPFPFAHVYRHQKEAFIAFKEKELNEAASKGMPDMVLQAHRKCLNSVKAGGPKVVLELRSDGAHVHVPDVVALDFDEVVPLETTID